MNITKIILTSLLAISVLCAMKQDMEQELLDAVRSRNLECAQLLINQQANVNAQNQYNFTPIMCAAYNGYTDMVQFFIDNRADVDAQSSPGETPLAYAARDGYTDIVKLLIDNQTNVNAQTEFGWTPLMRAARDGYTDIARALLHARADLSLKTISGDTAPDLAIRYNKIEIIKMIQQEPRVREETDKLRETALVLCAIRTHEPSSILSAMPNELLFLTLEHMAPDGLKRLLKQDQE
jgi:ankyrin repeat protein